MENKEDDIEDLFRDRFDDDEAPVSPRVWQNIMKTLPEDKHRFAFIFSQNMLLWTITGIFIVSAVIGAYIRFSLDQSSVSQPKTSITTSTNKSTWNEKTTLKQSNVDSSYIIYSDKKALEQKPVQHLTTAPNESSANQAAFHDENKNSHSILPYTKSTDVEHKTLKSSLEKRTGFNLSKSDFKNHEQIKNTDAIKKTTENTDPSIFSPKRSGLTKEKKSLEYRPAKDKTYSLGLQDTMSSNRLTATATDKDNAANSLKPKKTSSMLLDSSSFFQDTNASLEHSASNNLSIKDSLNKLKDSSPQEPKMVSAETTSLLENKNTDVVDSSFSLVASTSIISKANSNPLVSPDSTALNPRTDSLFSSIHDAEDSLLTQADGIHKDSTLTEKKAEKEKGKSNLLNRLSLDVLAAALLTGARTQARDDAYQATVEDKNEKDKNNFGYFAGILVNYQLNDRFKTSTGLLYASLSEQYRFNYTLKTTTWIFTDSTAEEIEIDSINRAYNVKDQYNFISIPLQLSYTFLAKEKLRLSAAAGLRADFLIKGVTHLTNASRTDLMEIRSGFNRISASSLFSLEAAYQWNEHTVLLLQPSFLYGISSIHSKASGIQQKPYGIGLTLGLRFTF